MLRPRRRSKGETVSFCYNPLVDDLVDVTAIVLNVYTIVFNCVGGKDNEGTEKRTVNLKSLYKIYIYNMYTYIYKFI